MSGSDFEMESGLRINPWRLWGGHPGPPRPTAAKGEKANGVRWAKGDPGNFRPDHAASVGVPVIGWWRLAVRGRQEAGLTILQRHDACPAQHHHDLVAAARNCTPRDGAASLIGREVVVGDRGPRRPLIRQPTNAEVRGEAMEFIDAVGQQVRPLQTLPAPDHIVDIERHIRPRGCPSRRPGRTQTRFPPGESTHRQPRTAALTAPRGNSAETGAVAGAPHLRARVALPCVREEPSAGIAVKPIQVRGQVRQAP
jgi:hypothetical protein